MDRKVFAEHEGKRVYFCCSSCPEEFRKDRAKYIKEMESQGVVLERSP
ncbi:MAG: TRASH domain-containing protein [Deltaproteobacteria bacterium]|nr:TRASH domain-containing protein [Deltaproteobacteria bacterium]